MTATKLSDADVLPKANHRWPEIVTRLTQCSLETLEPFGRGKPCPKCGGEDRFHAATDFVESGRVFCRGCFTKTTSIRPGNGIATVAWLNGIQYADARKLVAEFLNIGTDTPTTRDIVAEVAADKRMPLAAFRQFGAEAAKRGKLTVARVPVYNGDGEIHSYFDLAPGRKGLFQKGEGSSGMFFPGRLPQAGETWHLTEGVKDASALVALGYLAAGTPTCNLATKFVGLFRDVHVVLVPDLDTAGQDGAQTSGGRLAGVAASVRVARLPGEIVASKGDDVRDILRKPNGEQLVRDAIATAVEWQPTDEPKDDEPNEAVDDPHRLARLFIERYGTHDEEQTLRYWRDGWQRWDGRAYVTVDESEIRGQITSLAKREFDDENLWRMKNPKEGDEEEIPKCRKVTVSLVTNVCNSLSSLCLLPSRIEQPSWLHDADTLPPASEILATASGLIHLPSLVAGRPSHIQPTPQLFSMNVLPYQFDPQANCPEWLKFLESLWPDDPESIRTLQEWFGYCLLPDTRQHKFLMLIGPPRSGKGTIARVQRGLIGEQNLASPTLASLAGPFGLWPLVGKLVALVADARLSGRTDAISVVERLLSISGEDPQDVHRKNQSTLTGIRLPVRFTVMTNELPNMRDASGALLTRVLLLTMTRNWTGREDKALGNRLLTELPGILNWSIRGWQRLQERGYFEQPASGKELLADLEDIASPIKEFLRDNCYIGPEFTAAVDELFASWQEWCEEHGRDHPGTRQTFGRDLRAAVPSLSMKRPRDRDDSRRRLYSGIGMKPKPKVASREFA